MPFHKTDRSISGMLCVGCVFQDDWFGLEEKQKTFCWVDFISWA